MQQLNKIFLQGRLTQDPELRYTQNNIAMATFGIANDTGTKDKPKANFFNVTIWRTLAELASKYLAKGSMVLIEGKIEQDDYTDKNGVKRTSFRINADNFYFCGEKGKNSEASGQEENYTSPSPSEPKSPSTRQIEPDGYFPMNTDEFVPF